MGQLGEPEKEMMKIIKVEKEKRGLGGWKRKEIPNRESGPCVSKKKGEKNARVQKVWCLQRGEVSRWY